VAINRAAIDDDGVVRRSLNYQIAYVAVITTTHLGEAVAGVSVGALV